MGGKGSRVSRFWVCAFAKEGCRHMGLAGWSPVVFWNGAACSCKLQSKAEIYCNLPLVRIATCQCCQSLYFSFSTCRIRFSRASTYRDKLWGEVKTKQPLGPATEANNFRRAVWSDNIALTFQGSLNIWKLFGNPRPQVFHCSPFCVLFDQIFLAYFA